MALVGEDLYVANTDALVRVPYNGARPGSRRPRPRGRAAGRSPEPPLDQGLIASADGSKLYVAVGSNSNVAEHGMEHEEGRAAIWEFDRATGRGRVFAAGCGTPSV